MSIVALRPGSVLTAILVGFAFVSTSSSVQASCGDYIHILNSNDPTTHEQPKIPCPCQGPRCQQAPVIPEPMPIPASTGNTTVGDAILLGTIEIKSNIVEMIINDCFLSLCDITAAIFHPPRA